MAKSVLKQRYIYYKHVGTEKAPVVQLASIAFMSSIAEVVGSTHVIPTFSCALS